ncbi:hypothetical protein [Kriegella aquimaris]|uniref:Phosphoribosylpyrophosphate synthetase n=1 Tax=Kriegella aquimaris TaxID=192904 RepID=A0A1G9UNS5_9FLAO|nr:hypothetical protein [Kriegella aquimaris]SDM61526.1 hypothetical protein SAMN04488514_111106 [Kriegella aquimaris]
MENKFPKHEKNLIEKYQEKGFSANFYFKSEKLVASESKAEFSPKEVYIVAEHRYEGMSNPSDMSILYVLETKTGEKGTFLQAYGPNAQSEAAAFFNEIPDENISDSANLNLQHQ